MLKACEGRNSDVFRGFPTEMSAVAMALQCRSATSLFSVAIAAVVGFALATTRDEPFTSGRGPADTARDEPTTVGFAPPRPEPTATAFDPPGDQAALSAPGDQAALSAPVHEPDPPAAAPAPVLRRPLTIAAVNHAPLATAEEDGANAAALKAQILLDRAGFSPGAIDARDNHNYRKALAAFQRERGLDQTGALDPETWKALGAVSSDPVLGEYVIDRADVSGPFVPDLPDELEERTQFKRLYYRNALELLAEKFHMDQRLLVGLNPDARFDVAGARIVVARVERSARKTKVARIEVDKPQRRLRAYDKDGRLVAAYPASIGSEDKPTPSGNFVVRRVSRNPVWHYSPRFAFKEIKTTQPFRLAAGPNNPLGTVWIAISKPTYGIHGTPLPEEVGTTNSHGCVRLTNWDAQALAAMVTRGAKVAVLE